MSCLRRGIRLRSAGVFERWGSRGSPLVRDLPPAGCGKRSLHRNGICCGRAVPLRHPRPRNPGTAGRAESPRLPDAFRRGAAERPAPFSRSLPGRFPNSVARRLSNFPDAAPMTSARSCDLSNAFRRNRMRSLACLRPSRVRAMSALLLACSCPALWLVLSAQAAPPRRAPRLRWSRPRGRRSPIRPGSRGSRSTWSRRRSDASASARKRRSSARRSSPRRSSAGLFDGSAAAWKDPDRERALLFSQPVSREPSRARRPPRRGRIGARRSAHLKGKRWRSSRATRYGDAIDSAGADLGALAQRGGQPRATAQRRRRLHADGRARRPLHRQQLPRGIGVRRLQIGTTPLVDARAAPGDQCGRDPDAQSIVSASTRSCAA